LSPISPIALADISSLPTASGAARTLAYLDPGSGSYLLQLLIAGALGLGFALKMFWGRIKAFFLRTIGRETPGQSTPETPDHASSSD
jgi:hypothetical protein